VTEDGAPDDETVQQLRDRAERERREEAERIAERATRDLYARQEELELANGRLQALTLGT
jgi:hypothetical protein